MPLKSSSPFKWPVRRLKLKAEGGCDILWAGLSRVQMTSASFFHS